MKNREIFSDERIRRNVVERSGREQRHAIRSHRWKRRGADREKSAQGVTRRGSQDQENVRFSHLKKFV